MSLQAFFMQI